MGPEPLRRALLESIDADQLPREYAVMCGLAFDAAVALGCHADERALDRLFRVGESEDADEAEDEEEQEEEEGGGGRGRGEREAGGAGGGQPKGEEGRGAGGSDPRRASPGMDTAAGTPTPGARGPAHPSSDMRAPNRRPFGVAAWRATRKALNKHIFPRVLAYCVLACLLYLTLNALHG